MVLDLWSLSLNVIGDIAQGLQIVKEPLAEGDTAPAFSWRGIRFHILLLAGHWVFALFVATPVIWIARIVTSAAGHFDPEIPTRPRWAPWRPLLITIPDLFSRIVDF